MKSNYANADPSEWKRFFKTYDRESKDETGKIVIHSNAMEEMYQMFKCRLKEEG